MKLIPLFILSILAMLFSVKVSAQTDTRNSATFSQKDFDKQINHFEIKSKNQKKLAWILLGGGFLLNAASSALVSDNYSGTTSGYETVSAISSIATIVSIPLFFSASGNKNKSQLIRFERDVAMASSDSMKRIYLEDAAEYFSDKARSNKTTAIILSAVGGAFIVAGITHSGRNNYNDDIIDNLVGLLYTTLGVTIGGLSIPFYVRGGHLNRTARTILRTGRIPKSDLGYITPYVSGGQYVSAGIRVQL